MSIANHRILSTVTRWQVIPTTRRQSVAEHSYYVTVYALKIAEVLGIHNAFFNNELTHRALFHDLSEIVTGDMPTPYKKFIYGRIHGADIPGPPVPPTDTTTPAADRVARGMCAGALTDCEDTVGIYQRQCIERIVKTADLLEALVSLIEECASGNFRVRKCQNYLADKLKKQLLDYPPNEIPLVQQWVDDAIQACFDGADIVDEEMLSEKEQVAGHENGKGSDKGQEVGVDFDFPKAGGL